MKKLIFIALVLMNSIVVTKAQGFLEAHIGPAFPVGSFKDDDINDAIYFGAGNASTGLNLGIKYYAPLKTEGLSLVFGMDLFFNTLNKDFKDEFEAYLESDDYIDNITFPKYINVPVLGGVHYKIPISEKVVFFGEGNLGLNALKLTKFKYSGEQDGSHQFSYTDKFSPSIKIAYALGAGIWIEDKFNIGLKFYGLGSHKCKYDWEHTFAGDTDSGDEKFDKSLGVRAFTLTFGIKI